MDYSDCNCKKKLIDSLTEKCIENNDETKIVNITVKNENSSSNSCKVYIVLMTVVFTIFAGIIIYFAYYN